MNSDRALKLIRENGIDGLGEYDGCICTSFEICGISVDVSCRKSSGSAFNGFYGTAVRIYSRHLDCEVSDLTKIAVEVIAQVRKEAGHLPIKLRFCDYATDAEQKCTYCGKRRSEPDGYLCLECPNKTSTYTGRTIADQYAFDVLAADIIAAAMCVVYPV